MKILFVAMAESVHTTRWITQINDQGWEIHLFASNYSSTYVREIENVTTYSGFSAKKGLKNKLTVLKDVKYQTKRIINAIQVIGDKIDPDTRARQLCQLIDKIKPDIIHSLEFQSAGYLTLRAKQLYEGQFPIWIATNWGSDIYWFNRFKEHQIKIKSILNQCNIYSCECARDIKLAHQNGFEGKDLPVLPNSGGIDLAKVKKWRNPINKRKIILLKGKAGQWGRVLIGFEALKLCVKELRGYKIVVFSGFDHPEVRLAAKDFMKATGITVNVLPRQLQHDEMLKLHGKARISIGLSLSDGISTSFLEAIAMGSFPIQSNTACANEWVVNGQTGYLVPPEEPKVIAKAIKDALVDDRMVIEAAKLNYETASKKLDYLLIKKKVIDEYEEILHQKKPVKKNIIRVIYKNIVYLLLTIWIVGFFSIWLYSASNRSVSLILRSKNLPQSLRHSFFLFDNWFKKNETINKYFFRYTDRF